MAMTQQPLLKKERKKSLSGVSNIQPELSITVTHHLHIPENDKVYSSPNGGYMNQPGQSVLIPLGTMIGSIRTIIYKEQTIYKYR